MINSADTDRIDAALAAVDLLLAGETRTADGEPLLDVRIQLPDGTERRVGDLQLSDIGALLLASERRAWHAEQVRAGALAELDRRLGL